jgi:hypothetical protein
VASPQPPPPNRLSGPFNCRCMAHTSFCRDFTGKLLSRCMLRDIDQAAKAQTRAQQRCCGRLVKESSKMAKKWLRPLFREACIHEVFALQLLTHQAFAPGVIRTHNLLIRSHFVRPGETTRLHSDLKGSTRVISRGHVALHERVDRLSINETNSTLCSLL